MIDDMVNVENIVLYPKEIKEKSTDMCAELERAEEKIAKAKRAYEKMEAEEALDGQAWSSIKSYIRDVQKPYLTSYKIWKDEQREAMETYKTVAINLPNVIRLDKEQLEKTITTYETRIQRELEKKNPSHTRLDWLEQRLNIFYNQKNRLEDFCTAIDGIFGSANNLQQVMVKVTSEFDKIKLSEPKEGLEYREVVFGTPMQEMLIKAGMIEISKAGLDDDKIKYFYDLEFTKEEIAIACVKSKSEGDGDFIVNFVKKDYKSAFSSMEDNKVLGVSSALFALKYFSSMELQERELSNLLKELPTEKQNEATLIIEELRATRLSDLESFTNAILNIKNQLGVVDTDKAGENFIRLKGVAEFSMLAEELYAEENWDKIHKNEHRIRTTKEDSMLALASFFASNAIALKDNTSFYKRCLLSEVNISNLQIDNEFTGSYSYDIEFSGLAYVNVDSGMHSETTIKLDSKVNVTTEIALNNNMLENYLSQVKINELLGEKSRLPLEVLNNVMMDLALLGISGANEKVGAVAKFGVAMLNGGMTDKHDAAKELLENSGYEELESIKKIKGVVDSEAVEGTAILLDAIAEYTERNEQIEKELAEVKRGQEASWFSTGSVMYYDGDKSTMQLLCMGRYKTGAGMAIGKWEKVGLKGLLDLDEDLYSSTEEEKNTDNYKLYYGGADISNMDISELDNAVHSISEEYSDKVQRGNFGNDFKDRIKDYIKENN